MAEFNIFDTLSERAETVKKPKVNVYELLEVKSDFMRYKPKQWKGVVLKKLDFIEVTKVNKEEDMFVLKNPKFDSIYRLDESGLFLWEQMDGYHTVRDLLLAYYQKFGSFAYDKIVGLIIELKKTMMLSEKHIDVYEKMSGWARARKMTSRIWTALKTIFSSEWNIKKSDQMFNFLYRHWGRHILKKPVLYTLLVTTVVGMTMFIYFFSKGDLKLFPTAQNFWFGLIIFWALNMLVTFSHEISHGIVCKHFQCKVKNAGYQMYFGMPVGFVDTTDVWLANTKSRIWTSLAGPLNDLAWAGIAGLLLLIPMDPMIHIFIFQFAFINFINAVFNLNPLWELDGYYVLMDVIGIPCLKRRSWQFIKDYFHLRKKGEKKHTWTAEDKWLFGYGILSMLWLIGVAHLFYRFWKGQIVWIISAFKSSILSWQTLIMIGISLTVLLPLVLKAVDTVSKRFNKAT